MLATQAEWTLEAKHDLSSGVESDLTPKGRFDFSTGIKPHLKPEIEPASGSGIESAPEVEPGVAAVGPLHNILAEKDAVSEAAQESLWKTATKPFMWPKQLWEADRATIYLGTSMLIVLLVLSDSVWLPRRSPEPKELSLSLGLAAPPTMPVHYDNSDVGVWVDLHTGLYYCPGARLYGKTREGKLTTQRQARKENFKTPDGKACQ